MEASSLIYAASGLAALLAALLPRVLSRRPVSIPMVFLGAGVVAFAFIEALPTPDPIANSTFATHLTEVCVIIALFGAGLALDRPVGWRRWGSTWRLLAITMPLSILAVAFLGVGALGLGPAAALLLGAVLAPTDPVLAGDVQVGEPTEAEGEGNEDEPRFALTSEAGLNDALAFPFTYAAIAMATMGVAPGGWFVHWFAVDVLWRLTAGTAIGLVVGLLLARLFFHARVKSVRLAAQEQAEGFVALACTFLAYGLAEAAEGYGFLAVFVCACTIRAAERSSGYHGVMHGFIEQIERLLTVVLLVLLGGAIARGLLAELQPLDVVVAVLVVFAIRPLFGWIALLGSGRGRTDRAVMAFFGVRGIGSLYYMAYAIGQAQFEQVERLWAITGLVIVISVVVHGFSATPIMDSVDRRRRRKAERLGEDPETSAVPV
jgi:NhaP-type Na+/H+ or K+/H+ antiporter